MLFGFEFLGCAVAFGEGIEFLLRLGTVGGGLGDEVEDRFGLGQFVLRGFGLQCGFVEFGFKVRPVLPVEDDALPFAGQGITSKSAGKPFAEISDQAKRTHPEVRTSLGVPQAIPGSAKPIALSVKTPTESRFIQEAA